MNFDTYYKISMLEYAFQSKIPNGIVYSGYFNEAPDPSVTYTLTLLESDRHRILIDTGYDDAVEENHVLAAGCNIDRFVSPAEIVKRIGVNPEEISHIILTHCHWDHIGGLHLFANATFYIQKKEYLRWLEVLAFPKEYDTLRISLSYDALSRLVKLAQQGRLVLLDGDVDDLFPNIHVRLAEDGHTFGSCMTVIDNPGDRYVHIGDVAYLKRNILGPKFDGKSVPQSLGSGSIINRIIAMQDALALAGGNIEKLLIGHEPDSFRQFRTKTWEDGMRVAFITD